MRTEDFQEVAAVLRQYPASLKSARKEEGGYLIQTSEGTGWLQAWRRKQSLTRFLQVHRMLHEAGSSMALSLVRANNRRTTVMVNGKGYTLCRWSRQTAVLSEPVNAGDFRLWGTALGKFHRDLQGIDLQGMKDSTLSLPAAWISAFGRGRDRIEGLQRAWMSAGDLPKEEELFLKNIPQIVQRIDLAVSILEELTDSPLQTAWWSLGSRLPGSFIRTDSTESAHLRLAPWRSFSRAASLADLGRLLLRAMEQEGAEEKVQAALFGYEEQLSLRAPEYQVLLSYLVFPHWMWSLARQAGTETEEGLPRLPLQLDELRQSFVDQQRYRTVYAWLNREIAARQ